MRYRLRDRWPLATGAGLALATLAVGIALAVPALEVWALALTVLLVCLAAELWLERRIGLARERRLVRTAAALREATAQLERLASIDTLTGLYNRRTFFDLLAVEFRRARRHERDLAVVMLDIDRFKGINDEGGHLFGDAVLVQLARLLRGNLRASDTVGRYGGDEFIVILPETDAEGAAVVAEKLRQVIEACEFHSEEHLDDGRSSARVSVSLGVAARSRDDDEDAHDLVRRADDALYRAKRSGRNRVHVDCGATSTDEAIPA